MDVANSLHIAIIIHIVELLGSVNELIIVVSSYRQAKGKKVVLRICKHVIFEYKIITQFQLNGA